MPCQEEEDGQSFLPVSAAPIAGYYLALPTTAFRIGFPQLGL